MAKLSISKWLWVLVGSWLRPSLPKLTLPPECCRDGGRWAGLGGVAL